MDTTVILPLSPKSSTSEANSSLGTPDERARVRHSPNIDGNLLRPSNFSCNIGLETSTDDELHGNSEPVLCKDPFVTPRNQLSNLSPTASSFEPFNGMANSEQVSHLTAISSALSDEIGLSRIIRVSSFENIEKSAIEEVLSNLKIDGHLGDGERTIEVTGAVATIYFSDIREACAAYVKLRLTHTAWTIQYTDQKPAPLADGSVEKPKNNASLVISVAATNKPLDHFQVTGRLQDILQKFGAIFAIKPTNYVPGTYMDMSIEFCDTRAASSVIESSDDLWFDHSFSITRAWSHFVPLPASCLGTLKNSRQAESLRWAYAPSRQVRSIEQVPDSQLAIFPIFLQTSMAHSTSYSIDDVLARDIREHQAVHARFQSAYSCMERPFRSPPSPTLSTPSTFSPPRFQTNQSRIDTRRQTVIRSHRSPSSHSASHHNYVDVKRIRDGIDVRTTIMLRNIPNKVDQAMLKRLIDESSWGKYDFMYLRIDFANNCNVGYAFINFVDPLDIINFVHARGNQRWNCFKSDKVAEISYATIQGKDCLVQKFRNSSVMLEAAHYRPKLFFTSNGPIPQMAGQEEQFPGPDNQSKMKRSCENAEHVGLFTPNAGQQYRDEQRRRRSQYDRGTRLAALEEYDYSNSVQQLCIDPK